MRAKRKEVINGFPFVCRDCVFWREDEDINGTGNCYQAPPAMLSLHNGAESFAYQNRPSTLALDTCSFHHKRKKDVE